MKLPMKVSKGFYPVVDSKKKTVIGYFLPSYIVKQWPEAKRVKGVYFI